MTAPTIGSLFSGYGGLDLAAEHVLDARTVWTCDVDPAASRILRHRFPHAPNLGDITAVDWTCVPPVDVITGGFPCQDVSHAGARKGLGPGTRTGLWARMADAIDHLRPQLVIAENVRGLLSAPADSDVEPCPWCMGGAADGEPALRALGSVLADLAELGYDAAWHSLRAADVGAPHGRFRVFVLAWPADGDPGRERVQRRADPRGVAGTPRTGEGEGVQRERRRDTPSDASADAADAAGAGHEQPRREPGLSTEPARLRPAEPRRRGRGDAPDADEQGHEGRVGQGADPGGRAGKDRGRRPAPERRPTAADTEGIRWGRQRDAEQGIGAATDGRRPASPTGRARAAADPDGDGPQGVGWVDTDGRDTDRRDRPDTAWGPYEPAVRRWERTLGRPAPDPTEPNARNGQRLSPRFVEWMMGLDDGWVTAVPGLTRNDQLKALGNGVVPQQAAAALTTLLAWRAAAEEVARGA
jgi:DNA (cytosine-5)-methyltransferase 1